jgi:hypothetical protein
MCFSLGWWQQLAVMIVVIIAIVAIWNIIVPYLLSKIGGAIGEGMNVIMAVLRVVIWAIVAIFVIYICFALISCLLGYAGGFPLLPRGR